MIKHSFCEVALLLGLALPAHTDSDSRQATIVPDREADREADRGANRGNGKCSIEVNVDGVAEVDVSADSGSLRTISGQAATWRRFECNRPLPQDPADFQFVQVGGRGQATLVRTPRSNRGVATVRINDPQNGRAAYMFDLLWRDPGNGFPGGRGPAQGPWQGGSQRQTAIDNCQNSVASRLNRGGFRSVNFTSVIPQPRPAVDLISGWLSATRGAATVWFGYSCRANFRTGAIYGVDINPR